MNPAINYRLNHATEAEIAEHLSRCDADFVPPLTGRLEIKGYANKIAHSATRFEAWSDSILVGLVATYCNDLESRITFITSVSTLREWTGQGIASCLLKQCIEHAKVSGMRQISLEVANNNTPAINLYKKYGFVAGKSNAPFVTMNLYLESRE